MANDKDDKQVLKARRGQVTRSYESVQILAGFTDDNHFQSLAQESMQNLKKPQRDTLLKNVDKARQHVASQPVIDLSGVEIRPLEKEAYEKFEKDKTFQTMFSGRPYRFAWINPKKLIALQAFVKTQEEKVPTDPKQLIDFALPSNWSVPAEISFIPPMGPIYVVSSSPQLAGLEVSMDNKNGHVIIKPPSHANLIQVMHLNGRYYLRNGYHRVTGAIAEGIEELPAIVVDAFQPADVELPNLGAFGFSAAYFMGSPRPPLVSDFLTPASVTIEMREKRYGASVNLQISPISIGV